MSVTDLERLSDAELLVRREELAETISPLLLKLEMIDDVRMARRRAAQRARLLDGPDPTLELAALAAEEE